MISFVESSDALPLVDVEIAFPVGGLQDPVGREGLAQITAHLVRQGPRGSSQRRFEDRLAALGARMSVEVSMRSTRFRASVLSRNLEPLLELLARVVWDPALRKGDYAKLARRAQASLMARLDDDQTLGALQFRRSLFGKHPYARPLSGSSDSLRRIGFAKAKDFYERQLAKSSFVVGLAGDISERRGKQIIESCFPEPGRALRRDASVPPTRVRRGRRVIVVDKPARAQTQLFIGTLGATTRDPDLFPLIVSNTAFGGTFSGPLMQQVRGVRGWSYGAYSRLLHSTRRDAWYMWTAPSAEYSADCAALQLQLLERWVEGGIQRSELAFAQRYLINGHCFDRDTPSKRVEAKLDVELLGIPKRYVDDHDQLVSEVTRERANSATRSRISTRDLTIVVVATAAEVLPAFRGLSGVESVEVVPFDRI